MSILFNNRGVSHLSAPIGSGDTEIRIPWPDFSQFTRPGAQAGDTMMGILRGPIEREIVAIDLVNNFDGTTDKYLKVVRGQGGTSAEDWPAGTLLFLSTHADHYSVCYQPDGTRQIDFNPNGVISPAYRGEKVLQYAGCAVRWWMSFDDTNPYWQLITGEPCIDEVYQDPGWGFKVWFSAAALCWDSRLTDASWTPGADTTWNAGAQQWETTSADKWLYLNAPNGGWEVDYRPWLLKITRPILQDTKLEIRSNNSLSILQLGNLTPGDNNFDKEIGPDGYENASMYIANPTADDIDYMRIYRDDSSGKVQVSGIEFRLCDQVRIPTAAGYWGDVSRFESSWSAARNLGTGDAINNNPSVNGNVWASRYGFGWYEIHRTFLGFNIPIGVMSDIHFAVIRFDTAGNHESPNYGRRLMAQEGLQFSPLTLSHYNSFTGVPLTNIWDCTLFDSAWLELNDLGLAYLQSKIGGTAKFCVRDYQKDYLNVSPFDNSQYSLEDPNYTFRHGYPRLELYGVI